MPRKMYRLQEVPPPAERPGAGAPEKPARNEALERLQQTKRRVAESRAEVKKETERRRKEPEVSMRELTATEEAALGDELEAELESATDRLIEAEDRLRADPSIEHAKEVERIREEAQEIYLAKHEVKPEKVPVMKPKSIERREPRTAEQEEMARAVAGEVDRERAQMEKRDLLLGERDDLKKRMDEMGGVWGGEAYFVLNERLQEIERDLNKMGYATEAPRGKAAVEEREMPEGPTPEDKIADARKAMKFVDDAEREVAARQKKLQKELAKHGLKTPARIAEELGKIEEELRAEATGAKPTFWNRVQSLGRRLAGSEPSHATKELLKKWVELESEMNGYIHQRAEAQALIERAETEAGRVRVPRMRGSVGAREIQRGLRGGSANVSAGSSLEGFADTFIEAPEMRRGAKEVQVTLALKGIEEDIRRSLGEMESMQELTETELSEEMFEEKKSQFAKRIRALEREGKSEAFNEALEEAEEALMRYVMAVHARRQAFVEEARAAGKGEARPRSVIGVRAGEKGGAYAPGTPERRVVSMARMETADTRERAAAAERREVAEAPERVNREVEMYRSTKERKNLIDKINTDPEARKAMHGVYEAFKHRMLEKLANEEEVDFRTGSPDPALDYALNLYRKYARRADGKGYVYDLKIRHAAHGELEDIERVLGKNWDKDGWAARAVRAISRGKIELPTESTYEEFRAIEPEEDAEPIPLTRLKRARSEEELEEVEELDIPVTVEAPITEAAAQTAEEIPIDVEAPVSVKERPVVSAEAAEQEALAEASERQRKIDEEAEQAFEASLGGFRPASEVLSEAAKAEEASKRREPAWERGRPFDSPEQEAAIREEIQGLMSAALQNEEKMLELQYLSKYKPTKDSSLADAMISLYMNAVTARPGVRKRGLRRELEHAWEILRRETVTPEAVEPSEEEARLTKIRKRINGIRKNKARMSSLEQALGGVKGDTLANRVNALFKEFEAAQGAQKEALLERLNAAREALGLRDWEEKKSKGRRKAPPVPTGIPPALDETPASNVISLDERRRRRAAGKK